MDSVPCLTAWAESLGGIQYPLLSDFYPHGGVAQAYGVLRSEGYGERALFLIDKQGILRSVDVHDIDDQPDNEELFTAISRLEPDLSAKVQKRLMQEAAQFKEPRDEIVMYCTPWCPDCRQARTFLQEHAISYTEVDISRNWGAAQLVRSWNGGKEVTPTFKIRGEVMADFSVDRLAQELGT